MITIVPAIDIIGGKCVRLSKGDYSSKKVYNESPLDVAKEFADAGCSRLHVVDLDGAASNKIVNYSILEKIASITSLAIDFGGGIKSYEDAHIAFSSGAEMITGGSIAVKDPVLFQNLLHEFGSKKVILGADANNGKIATNGWVEQSDREIVQFIQEYMKLGIEKVISTDIQCDGMLAGPSLDLYKKIMENNDGVFLIASGGVSSLNDIYSLNSLNIPEVIVGKAIYEGNIKIKDIENFNSTEIC